MSVTSDAEDLEMVSDRDSDEVGSIVYISDGGIDDQNRNRNSFKDKDEENGPNEKIASTTATATAATAATATATAAAATSASAMKYRRYKRHNEIAFHCQKLLRITALPTVQQLTLLINLIQKDVPERPSEAIRSEALLWFRKRREYLAAKIYQQCDLRMPMVWPEKANVPAIYEEVVTRIVADESLMQSIARDARLPIKKEANAIDFVQRKVIDYFTKLCSET